MKKLATDILKDTFAIIIGAIAYAAGLCIFAAPSQMLSGGASGIATVINSFTGLGIGLGTFLVNVPIFIATLFVCGKRYTLRTIYCCFLFSTVIDVFDYFVNFNYSGDKLLCALYGGLLMGAGLYVIMMRSIVTGGSDLLAYLIQRKYPAYSISTLVMIIDGIVVIGGAIAYRSADSALYSVLLTIMLTLTLNTLLRGRSHGGVYFILSQHADEIVKKINDELERGATIIDAKGSYTGENKQMIMCAVGKRQSGYLRKLVFETDPTAFVITGNAESVYGEGFVTPGKEDIF